MSSSALPPLGNLPSWSRVSTLDRSRYPKPFLRDRLQTLPPAGVAVHQQNGDRHGDGLQMATDMQILDNLTPSEQKRLVYYNKSIKFLQQQHADTLTKLHEEIDRLKQENKDLQFKFVMNKKNPAKGSSDGHIKHYSSDTDKSGGELQSIILQEEVKDLQQALKHAQGRNAMLQQALWGKGRSGKSRKTSGTVGNNSSTSLIDDESSLRWLTESVDDAGSSGNSSLEQDSSYLEPIATEPILPPGLSLDPLRVQESSGEDPRSPSLPECEVIIRYLHGVSARQREENSMLKSDLKDLLQHQKHANRYSTKSNLTEARSEEVMRLPKVSLKHSLPKHNSAQLHASSTDRIVLPALKHSMNTNIADRRKRQQAVQKSRTRKDGPHNL
uniref:Coiled-coil domain-containing protein 74B-like n=1 Tax=Phallusia mammillata TaxID=59560 RepID=A0A6F9D821_9ASCI|nr:coiled-coil domain-containing protein 74B-like [Phallusia mammillata]